MYFFVTVKIVKENIRNIGYIIQSLENSNRFIQKGEVWQKRRYGSSFAFMAGCRV